MEIWKEWSDAAGEFITPIDDQYGPCRVGPSYPFLFGACSLRQTWGMTMKFPWTKFNELPRRKQRGIGDSSVCQKSKVSC